MSTEPPAPRVFALLPFGRALCALLVTTTLAGCGASDSWPGDASATTKHQQIHRARGADAISLADVDGGRAMTRARLCERLVDRHFDLRAPGPAQTNAAYLACPDLDRARLRHECERTLANPDGYDGPEGWRRWAGEHRGTWFDDGGRRFDDRAIWSQPRRERTRVAGDAEADGSPRVYDFQPVVWPGRSVGRRGWNQSHPDVPYVWGWDPKENGDAGGDIGTHVGYPIDLEPCHFIIWFTPKEAFLEGINGADPTDRRKASTGFFGRGQWRVR